VLEEWRLTRTSGGRMQEAHWKLILEGSKCGGEGGLMFWRGWDVRKGSEVIASCVGLKSLL